MSSSGGGTVIIGHNSVAQTTVPTITGNPGIDSLIRSALIAASAALTGVVITWANAHGFTNPDLSLLIGGAVFTTLVTVATMAWGYIKGTQIGQLITVHEQAAVAAGANLALSGNVITTTDQTGATVAAPFTPTTVKAVIAAYAPPAPKT